MYISVRKKKKIPSLFCLFYEKFTFQFETPPIISDWLGSSERDSHVSQIFKWPVWYGVCGRSFCTPLESRRWKPGSPHSSNPPAEKPPISTTLICCYVVDVAARIREMLECAGMSNVVSSSSAQVLANVASLLNTRDTEMSRWVLVWLALSVSVCCYFELIGSVISLLQWEMFLWGRLAWKREELKRRRSLMMCCLIILGKRFRGWRIWRSKIRDVGDE